MLFIKYEDLKPKNLFEFPKLYKKTNKILNKLWYQLETVYGRKLTKKELKNICRLYFKVKKMAECYKYVQEENEKQKELKTNQSSTNE